MVKKCFSFSHDIYESLFSGFLKVETVWPRFNPGVEQVMNCNCRLYFVSLVYLQRNSVHKSYLCKIQINIIEADIFYGLRQSLDFCGSLPQDQSKTLV